MDLTAAATASPTVEQVISRIGNYLLEQALVGPHDSRSSSLTALPPMAV